MFTRVTITVAALMLGLLADGPAVKAAENADRLSAAARLNEAGRQRMLSQRMSKAACLAQMGVDAKLHRKMAKDAATRFDLVLKGLQTGDADIGLAPETSRTVQIQLEKTQALWNEFQPVLERMTQEGQDAEALSEMRKRNVPLLKQMNRAVAAIQSEMASGIEVSERAMAINLAGRQRMLSQKVVKELCLLEAGLDPEADRNALRETVAEFEETLHDLREGNQARGLVPAPSWDIDAQLEIVESLWFEMASILQSAISGGTPGINDLGYAAFLAEAVLKEMNTAVLMYEKL